MTDKKRSSGQKKSAKVTLVTGASQGIGLAIAEAMAAKGYAVVITGRNPSTLQSAAKKLAKHKTDVLPLLCDVRDPMAVGELFAAIEGRFHRLDVLVNNAGVAHSNLPVANLPLAAWTEVIETNLTGLFLVTRAALGLMKPGGVIVNNLSISAKKAFPGMSAYTASKHGGLGFTNTLREELRERQIRVIAVLPGATDTDIWNAFWREAPRKKMMSARTVADAVVQAISVPPDGTVEEVTIRPLAGTL